MSLLDIQTTLIDAPHLQADGVDNAVLEVDALWQYGDVVALLFHPNPVSGGTMTNKVVATLYRHARNKGYHVVRYNSRGVGKSSGTATASLAEFADALCVLQWIQNQTTASKIWLGGFSFGGFMACVMADFVSKQSKLILQKLVLIAPSIERNDINSLDLDFAKIRMIYGKDDDLVNPAILADFAYHHQIRHQAFEDVGHFFHGRLSDLTIALNQLDN